MSTGRIVMFALDAIDPGLAREWAAELPNIRRLFSESAQCEVRNPFGIIAGLWVSFATGLAPGRHGFHCWEKIDPATYEQQAITPSWNGHAPFWRTLSEEGRRIAVIDLPHDKVTGPVNGVEIAEWGSHDRHFGLHGWPPERAESLVERFGFHPVFGTDGFAVRDFAPDDEAHRRDRFRTPAEDRELLDALSRGVALKQRLLAELMVEEKWDFFLGAFSEGHAAGHQLWHLHDPAHHRFDAAAAAATGDALLRIYRETDAALGALLEHVGGDATLLILMSHGMGPNHNGTHLVEEVLARIDRFNRGEKPIHPVVDSARRAIRPIIPWLQRLADAAGLPARWRNRLGRAVAITGYAAPEARARQSYFMAPNNFLYGGVRINMKGREARGCVDPADFDRVAHTLRDDLLAIVNVETGGPVVAAVERVDRHHRRSPGDTLPDLVIAWERTAPIQTVASPKIGIVHVPDPNSRTGDHHPDGLLLARGEDLVPGASMPAIRIEDIAPSIAARLGVRLDDVDGTIVPWLAGKADQTAVLNGVKSVPVS